MKLINRFKMGNKIFWFEISGQEIVNGSLTKGVTKDRVSRLYTGAVIIKTETEIDLSPIEIFNSKGSIPCIMSDLSYLRLLGLEEDQFEYWIFPEIKKSAANMDDWFLFHDMPVMSISNTEKLLNLKGYENDENY